jgi:hypothetical protein
MGRVERFIVWFLCWIWERRAQRHARRFVREALARKAWRR